MFTAYRKNTSQIQLCMFQQWNARITILHQPKVLDNTTISSSSRVRICPHTSNSYSWKVPHFPLKLMTVLPQSEYWQVHKYRTILTLYLSIWPGQHVFPQTGMTMQLNWTGQANNLFHVAFCSLLNFLFMTNKLWHHCKKFQPF